MSYKIKEVTSAIRSYVRKAADGRQFDDLAKFEAYCEKKGFDVSRGTATLKGKVVGHWFGSHSWGMVWNTAKEFDAAMAFAASGATSARGHSSSSASDEERPARKTKVAAASESTTRTRKPKVEEKAGVLARRKPVDASSDEKPPRGRKPKAASMEDDWAATASDTDTPSRARKTSKVAEKNAAGAEPTINIKFEDDDAPEVKLAELLALIKKECKRQGTNLARGSNLADLFHMANEAVGEI